MAAPNLTQLLSKLRAPIFNTLPVTSNARTGTKYLRRRLRGPAVLNYVGHGMMPNIKTLNANTEHNKYFGWDGRARVDGKQYHLPSHLVVAEGWTEVERKPRPGPPVPPARREAEAAARPSGWLEDPNEYVRFEDVARKRKLGKGPPKKGESRLFGSLVRAVGTTACLLSTGFREFCFPPFDGRERMACATALGRADSGRVRLPRLSLQPISVLVFFSLFSPLGQNANSSQERAVARRPARRRSKEECGVGKLLNCYMKGNS